MKKIYAEPMKVYPIRVSNELAEKIAQAAVRQGKKPRAFIRELLEEAAKDLPAA
jgi:predicted DNA-binding protein